MQGVKFLYNKKCKKNLVGLQTGCMFATTKSWLFFNNWF